jgi:hypothetical protein
VGGGAKGNADHLEAEDPEPRKFRTKQLMRSLNQNSDTSHGVTT